MRWVCVGYTWVYVGYTLGIRWVYTQKNFDPSKFFLKKNICVIPKMLKYWVRSVLITIYLAYKRVLNKKLMGYQLYVLCQKKQTYVFHIIKLFFIKYQLPI